MSEQSKMKSGDRQRILKRLVSALRKRYSGGVPKRQFPVMESLIFAALLEDSPRCRAEEAYDALLAGFHEFNEIRVSMISEIEEVLGEHVADAGMRGLRIREVLQYAFEKNYDFQMEELKRLTLDSALKELGKIPHVTDFMKSYALQNCLGAHIIPLDAKTLHLLEWLSVCEPKTAGDELKSAIRKSEGVLLAHLLHEAACDPVLNLTSSQDDDPSLAVQRLEQAFKPQRKKSSAKKGRTTKVVKKPVSAARKSAARSTTKKAVKKKVTKPKTSRR